MMNETYRHFDINWMWEDSLAHAAQALAAGGDRTAVGG
jgi:hypothetical protein